MKKTILLAACSVFFAFAANAQAEKTAAPAPAPAAAPASTAEMTFEVEEYNFGTISKAKLLHANSLSLTPVKKI